MKTKFARLLKLAIIKKGGMI